MKTERNVRSPDLFERKGYADDGEFDWTGRTMSTPVNNCLQNICTTVAVIAPQVQNQDPISPSGRGRHNTGKDGKVRVSSVVASNLFPSTGTNTTLSSQGTPAWSESKPSGIDIMVGGGRLTDNRHPSVQVHR